MTDTIQFFVEGDPKPQPRPRAFSIGGTARVYDPHTAEGWKSAIADAARPHCPAEPWRGPVEIALVFTLTRP
ncbi:MAG: RusA family crossover junction endodeoxyribonuclease, partial [Gemmatimonadetes bacterium]|nr:RusA family crossover junction endodeoxyribonuclease [Gemmatimonadota bacterium]